MSLPSDLLTKLAQEEILATRMPIREAEQETWVLVQHIRNGDVEKGEDEVLFDAKKIVIPKIEGNEVAVELLMNNIREHYVVNDFVSLEMLLRLWIPNIDTLTTLDDLGIALSTADTEVEEV
jgi:hypothetical protein